LETAETLSISLRDVADFVQMRGESLVGDDAPLGAMLMALAYELRSSAKTGSWMSPQMSGSTTKQRLWNALVPKSSPESYSDERAASNAAADRRLALIELFAHLGEEDGHAPRPENYERFADELDQTFRSIPTDQMTTLIERLRLDSEARFSVDNASSNRAQAGREFNSILSEAGVAPVFSDIATYLDRPFDFDSLLRMDPQSMATAVIVDATQAVLQPLSSFATSAGPTDGFGRTKVVISVPRERIFSTAMSGPGCLAEDEMIVVGGVVDADVIHDREKKLVQVAPTGDLLSSSGGVVQKAGEYIYLDVDGDPDWPKRTPDQVADIKAQMS